MNVEMILLSIFYIVIFPIVLVGGSVGALIGVFALIEKYFPNIQKY